MKACYGVFNYLYTRIAIFRTLERLLCDTIKVCKTWEIFPIFHFLPVLLIYV